MPKQSPTNLNTFYAWLRTIVVVAIALLASETFVVLGIVKPLRIEGSSMAPTLLGPHVEVTCPHCEHRFAVAADQVPTIRPYVCPDCRRQFDATPSEVTLGERMWVNRAQLAMGDVERWDVVVFRCPERTETFCIKRVLGLPGEQVDFASGDLLINGHVLRKSLAEQLRLRQLVHLERTQLLTWHPEGDNWQFTGDAWRHEGEVSRLEYLPSGGVVTDDLGINQTASRPTYTALDLMVTAKVHLAPGASLRFEATWADGRVLARSFETPGELQVTWSLFDRQALLAVDGKVVWSQQSPGAWPAPPRLAVVASGDVQVADLAVWRDAYYHTRPVDRWPLEGVKLGARQLFVVGDNVAISQDSRTWSTHALPQELLIGVPVGTLRDSRLDSPGTSE